MKNLLKQCLAILFLLLSSTTQANPVTGETIQINTQFREFVGKPTWLLIVRDVNTGLVTPYIFDIRNNENYWVAFTYGHTYRITVSNLKFGTYAEVPNFCGLENGILSGSSMYMVLKGVLTPDPKTTHCFVQKYRDSSL